MRSNTKKIIILIVLGMVFVFIPNVKFNFNDSQKTRVIYLKDSGEYTEHFIHIDGNIVNNWTWTVGNYSWCYGEGTYEEPYIIENVTINASSSPTGSGIFINNSKNEYFIIRNCIVYKAGSGSFNAGIKLENTNNGTLTNNNCSNNDRIGIFLIYHCENNTVSGNIANNNWLGGIYLNDFCNNNTITGNIAWYATDNNGIYLNYGCNNNIISGNNARINNNNGIALNHGSNKNIVSGNNVSNNGYHGINLNDGSNDNTIFNNAVNDNGLRGIVMFNCNNNTISGNNMSNVGTSNQDIGIYLVNNCDYNNITGNTVNDNQNIGIYIYEYSDNNTISGNTVWNNLHYGIYCDRNCINNTISGNTICNHTIHGIELNYWSHFNTISGNTVSDSGDIGIYIDGNCQYNTISGNTVSDNNVGIYIEDGCHSQSLYENFFLKNGKHAFDYGALDTWNSTTIGNYWDNHTGPDVEEDGIVDIPYNISGYAGSKDYLPIAEDGIPTIDIKSPKLGDIFGTITPSFNVIISDDYLDKMWYTIDSGLHNYTFTTNSTINQTAWYTAAEGNITLTFYASDIPGNIGTEEVIIVKDSLPPVITINSPIEGDKYGKNAPLFNITVTDDHLDTMWYTIDGGLHNYTFTTNSTINQTAWDTVAEGNVTLTFYASDILGNNGTEEIIIVKDYEAPTISINSPTSGNVFGSDTPSFIVRITDDYLVSMWYTIDSGLHNYTFTTNSTINQTAWDAISDGSITLSFYAIDDLGHIGSAGVSIIKDTVLPVISINSPIEGDKYGKNAPLFNITVTEDHLDTMWYTLNNGLTKYFFTINGTIDQTAWDALSEGSITITFYANDTAGNLASEEVAVTKHIPEVVDVFLIVIIFSIVGGIAIIIVFFAKITKKRK